MFDPLLADGAVPGVIGQRNDHFGLPGFHRLENRQGQTQALGDAIEPRDLAGTEVSVEGVAGREAAALVDQALRLVGGGLVDGQFEPQFVGAGESRIEAGGPPVEAGGQQMHRAEQNGRRGPVADHPHRRFGERRGGAEGNRRGKQAGADQAWHREQ